MGLSVLVIRALGSLRADPCLRAHFMPHPPPEGEVEGVLPSVLPQMKREPAFFWQKAVGFVISRNVISVLDQHRKVRV